MRGAAFHRANVPKREGKYTIRDDMGHHEEHFTLKVQWNYLRVSGHLHEFHYTHFRRYGNIILNSLTNASMTRTHE